MDRKIRKSAEVPFGYNISVLRTERGYTQDYMVSQLQQQGIKISREIYSQIERGVHDIPASWLISIRDILDVSLDDIFKC